MKLSDIAWNMVRMVSISDCTLRLTLESGVLTYHFENPDQLSEALLILALTGTRKVEFLDQKRFNPARFSPAYKIRKALSNRRTIFQQDSGPDCVRLKRGSARRLR